MCKMAYIQCELSYICECNGFEDIFMNNNSIIMTIELYVQVLDVLSHHHWEL